MTAVLTRNRRSLRPGAGEPPQLSAAGIAVLLLGAFLPIVDFFVVNVALPTIDASLHASAPTLELVVALPLCQLEILFIGQGVAGELTEDHLLVAGSGW